MSLSGAQRLAVLAGLALLGAAIALAVAAGRRSHSTLPPAVGSYAALAASSGSAAYGRHTACGQIIGPRTEGVAQPVLPCGLKLYVAYGDRHVLTEVIDHGPAGSGSEFALTAALARRLDLVGVRTIRWSYAGAG